MQLKTGNLWEELGEADLICVTTNSALKRNGELVMGAGIAREAARRFPNLPLEAGRLIAQKGLTLSAYFLLLPPETPKIALFQTKYHFSQDSNPYLIREAAHILTNHAQSLEKELGRPPKIHLNFPGIGMGKLKEEDVLPLLAVLPDCVTVWKKG